MLGRTEPRLWTPPLRELTPETSVGFDQIHFARATLRHPLDPWQEWAAIHAGELLPDGRPRFRIILVLVARQNGKTELLVVLTLYWQFVEAVPLILGTSTKLDYAKESWSKGVKLAERTPDLTPLRPTRWKRDANGEQESWTTEESRYKIAACNDDAGRSLTVDRLILDELRQHHTYAAWNAAESAASPIDAQVWAISNAGDTRSVVLNDLRDEALRYIETGEGDWRLGLFEWSSPEDADPLDLQALAEANPNLGRRKDPDALLSNASRAVSKGGAALTGFKTEQMCIYVRELDPAIDPAAWSRSLEPAELSTVVGVRIAMCLDLAPDLAHATLAAAAVLPDGRVRGAVVADWEDIRLADGTVVSCTKQLRSKLPGLVVGMRPQVLGWLPAGPAAAVTADLAKRTGWPPRGVTVEAIRSETPAVCMGFAALVSGGQFVHSGDELLDKHAGRAQKLWRGDVWVFSRRGGEHIDATYAMAGAVHLARTLPPAVGKPRLIVTS